MAASGRGQRGAVHTGLAAAAGFLSTLCVILLVQLLRGNGGSWAPGLQCAQQHVVRLTVMPHAAAGGAVAATPGVPAAGAPAGAAAPSPAPLPATKARDPRHDVARWVEFAAADSAAMGTTVSAECDAALGATWLRKWAAARGKLCGDAGAAGAGASGRSSVSCYAYPVRRGLACFSRDLVLEPSAFLGVPPPAGAEGHEAYLPKGAPGSVLLGCDLAGGNGSSAGVLEGNLRNDSMPWFNKAARGGEAAAVEAACGGGSGAPAVEHPVVFVARADPTNPYHFTQSLVQAFLSMSLAAMGPEVPLVTDPAGLQVIIADHFVDGPFTEIWRRLSAPHPVLTLPDVAARLAVARGSSGGDVGHGLARVCYRKSIEAHYALPGDAFLGYQGIGQPHTCPSTLYMAFAHWQRYLFAELLPASDRRELEAAAAGAAASGGAGARVGGTGASAATPAGAAGSGGDIKHSGGTRAASGGRVISSAATGAGDAPAISADAADKHRRLNVVWLSRAWFGRRMAAGGGLTSWQAERQMGHEDERAMVTALHAAVLDWNKAACAPPAWGWWQARGAPKGAEKGCKPSNATFDFHSLDPSAHDLAPDQLLLLTRAAIIVSVHGAALNNMVWMRPHRGAVVELSAGGNYHYANMAAMLGHRYVAPQDGAPGNVAAGLRAAMDHVATRY